MNQIESLTAFISQNLPDRAQFAFQSVIEDCEILRSAKARGKEQKRIGVMRYNAVLSWDRFPYRECSPGVVYALVLTWLSDHANDLRTEMELPDPTVDPEFDDETACILSVVVSVVDEIVIKPSDTGPIPSKGQRWDLVYPEIWTATDGRLYAAAESGAPLGGGSEG
jgi:hypothetical protein